MPPARQRILLWNGLIAALATAALMLCTGTAAARSFSEPRLALVIGNSDYQSAPLSNPRNDAKDIAETLERLGFQADVLYDASQREMFAAIARFGKKLSQQKNAVGLFYYAGHGIQFKGRNYLIPVDSDIGTPASVTAEAVNANVVLEQMAFADNRLNIAILDACRNNPFSGFRSGSTGLASIDAPMGTLIAYATAPGRVARDGDGENGLYTSVLLRAMQEPGRTLEDVFKYVRYAVSTKTDGSQVPWESSSLIGNFYFLPPSEETQANRLGTLEVRTYPPDSIIKIDGVIQGSGPSFDLKLKPRTYRVSVEHEDYVPRVAEVDIDAQSTSHVFLSLTPKDEPRVTQGAGANASKRTNSNLIVEVLPTDARVMINGDREKIGPVAEFTLAAGRYLVEVRKPGYEPQSRVVSLSRQEAVRAMFSLIPLQESVIPAAGRDSFQSLPPP